MDREEPADLLHPLTSLELRECSGPPTGVYNAGMVCLGDKVYVGGGGLVDIFRGHNPAKLYIYSPATDTWDTMDTPVYNFALTVYHSQLVLVGGWEKGGGRSSNKVWTLGEDCQWQTTLPPMETACLDASAVSHGDHIFVIDDERVYIYNGHKWTRAQRPTFSPKIMLHMSSTVIDGCWYVMSGAEVRYASLDSLLASCQPSDTPQSSSVWKRLPGAPRGSLCLTKFGNRLIVVGGITSYMCVFSPTTQSWVQVWSVPYPFPSFPCAVVLPSNQLFVMAGSMAYIFTIKVTPFNPLSHFTMRALSLVEAAGIPFMNSLKGYTARIENILQLPITLPPHVMSIEPLMSVWLDRHASTLVAPTWSNLLHIIHLFNLHDLAERVESCLKAKTVDRQHKVAKGMDKDGKMSAQDEVIFRLKQKVASLEEERDKAVYQVEELRYEIEKSRHPLQEMTQEEDEEKPLALFPVKTELKEEAATVTKAETTSDIAAATPTWVLPGVEVCGEMTVVVHSSRSQQITWEGFGLRLHIDKDSLPAGMEQCTLKIMASLAGQYELPEKSCLVSAVFWLRCEPMCTFTKPVTVEIQHCAKSENVGKLKFVRAVCSQKQFPYTFKELRGGHFNKHSSYGVIQVNGFSAEAIVQEGSEDREYCSHLYYIRQHNHSYKIHFVVTSNVEAQLTVVKKEYEGKGAVLDLCQPLAFESEAVTLDIPMEGLTVTPWKITPQMRPVVTKKQVDSFLVGKLTPYCQLLAQLQVDGRKNVMEIPSLSYQVSLKGAQYPNDVFVTNLPVRELGPTPRDSERSQLEDNQSATEATFSLAGSSQKLGPPPSKRSRLEDDQSATGTSLTLAGPSQELELGLPRRKRSRLEDDQSATAGSLTPAGPSQNPPHSDTIRLNSDHHASLLQQLEKHAARWRDIGTKLGFTQGELDNIGANQVSATHGPESYLSRLLSKWLEWAPGDGRGSQGFATLEGLRDALLKANIGGTAYSLHL